MTIKDPFQLKRFYEHSTCSLPSQDQVDELPIVPRQSIIWPCLPFLRPVLGKVLGVLEDEEASILSLFIPLTFLYIMADMQSCVSLLDCSL